MLRSSLLVVAIFVAGVGAGRAQVSSDPQAVSPIVYSGAPGAAVDCAGDSGVDAQDPHCLPGDGAPPVDDYSPDYDYVPDYWETPPAYAAAPGFYLGVSLAPAYWGWPWYGYYGWPYYGYSYGYGWPYYGYCCYWGGSWGWYAWNDHGHHDHGDHGGWGDHGGHGDHGHWGGHGGAQGGADRVGHGDYPGPYRYLGHGQYANQSSGSGNGSGLRGDRPARVAGSERAGGNLSGLARSAAPSNGVNRFADVRGALRSAAFAHSSGNAQERFAGRAVLPSASYYAAARSAANPAYSGARSAQATNYRGSAAESYGYTRGGAGNAAAANHGYRATGLPSRDYAANHAGGRQAMARPGGDVASRGYAGHAVPSYPQQRYAGGNRAYTRGGTPAYSAARGPMPSYSYAGRGTMPSYARGGSYSAPRAVQGGGSAPHGGGGGSAHGGGHPGTAAHGH